ncbi:MAG: YbhB/YbcL family Raf kinase inhibitor-like protein [Actinomycetota bacterium]|nr:YbhB/YbcL family Raf kinase inhibitor-like protein [Actinomycetota bacterium]
MRRCPEYCGVRPTRRPAAKVGLAPDAAKASAPATVTSPRWCPVTLRDLLAARNPDSPSDGRVGPVGCNPPGIWSLPLRSWSDDNLAATASLLERKGEGDDMASVVASEIAADAPLTLRLTSSAFADGELMAQRYTCDGTNASPPLQWEGVPEGSAELVLVCEDPEPAAETFVHWLVCGLDPDSAGIEEDSLPEGATLGLNDFGQAAYGGPCPPHGHEAHNYIFTLLAVGTSLALEHRFTAQELVTALQEGTILVKGQLIGRYGRTDLSGPRPPAYTG